MDEVADTPLVAKVPVHVTGQSLALYVPPHVVRVIHHPYVKDVTGSSNQWRHGAIHRVPDRWLEFTNLFPA